MMWCVFLFFVFCLDTTLKTCMDGVFFWIVNNCYSNRMELNLLKLIVRVVIFGTVDLSMLKMAIVC